MLVVARSAHPRERCAHAGQPPCWSVSSGLRGTRLKGLRSTARRPPPSPSQGPKVPILQGQRAEIRDSHHCVGLQS